MPIDSKLTNVIGAKMPFWIVNQLETRANKGALSDRSSNDNLQYLSNKTAWVRMVSSVDVSGSVDLQYFQQIDPSIKNPSDLAKNYMLFGGTSKYLKDQSYQLRWGLHNVNNQVGGAYGMLGDSEIQNYGYRPMPGITRVHIDTQGRLGSVRHATIDIKCWDKAQLDIIDALYFKLGYTMFLEWGHTYYYPNEESDKPADVLNTDKVKSSEFMSLDPFAENLSKEELMRRISENSRASYGNYDGMLGIVTNFNFSYNQEGGYDCTVRMMGLGVLGDSIKINNPSNLIPLLTDEIQLLNYTLSQINVDAETKATLEAERAAAAAAAEEAKKALPPPKNLDEVIQDLEVTDEFVSYPSAGGSDSSKWNTVATKTKDLGDLIFIKNINRYFSNKTDYKNNTSIKLSATILSAKIALPAIPTQPQHSGGNRLFFEQNWIRIEPSTVSNLIDDISLAARYLFSNEGLLSLFSGTGLPNLKDAGKVAITDPEAVKKVNEAIQNEKTLYIDNIYLGTRPVEDKILINNNYENKYKTWANYYGQESKFYYNTSIKRNIFAAAQDIKVKESDSFKEISITDFAIAFNDYLSKNLISGKDFEVKYAIGQYGGTDSYGIKFIFKFNIPFELEAEVDTGRNTLEGQDVKKVYEKKKITYLLPVEVTTDDTSIIEDIIIFAPTSDIIKQPGVQQAQQAEEAKKKAEEEKRLKKEQAEEEKALLAQISEALGQQSNIETSLRTIQVRALNSAFYQRGGTNIDLSIGRKVYAFDMTRPVKGYKEIDRSLAKTVFSNGLYDGIIQDLIDGKIDNSKYFSSEKERLKINAKYGFATTLMGSDSSKDSIFQGLEGKEVQYSGKESILQAYVIPYEYSSDLVAGIKVNHPVYIPFGLLLMLLNHSCTLYDEKNSDTKSASSNFKKPIVYLDYNTKLNFFQTCPQQMSTNPWVALMRVECNKEEYKKLFNKDVIENDKIVGISNNDKEKSTGQIPIFDPENGDLLSYQLPKVKVDKNFTGNVMNILLNIDYLVEVIRSNSFKDGTNGVYLKPFLEEVITDVNKYLGNFNAFRLNYSDKANTFQIVDDQYVYTDLDLSVDAIKQPYIQKNRTEIPLVGRYSVAKSLELKTEMGSKLANLIAISANSSTDQSQNSTEASSVGFVNDSYVDRLVPKRVSAGGQNISLNGEIAASQQFNRSIEDFYASIQPSKDDVSQATAFLIDKISNVKNETKATRASAMIPLGVNFTTDGISGMSMYQTFTVSNNLLPYTYYAKKSGAFIDGQTTLVAFVVVGLTHTIENNVWNTSVRSNMISVKDKTVFSGEVVEPKKDAPVDSNVKLFKGPTPNANKLREAISELQKDYPGRISYVKIQDPSNPNVFLDKLSLSEDITENLQIAATSLFTYALSNFSDLTIFVGGGNDLFHIPLGGPHTRGKGLDFTVNKKYAVRFKGVRDPDLTDPSLTDHKRLDDVLQKFVKDVLSKAPGAASLLDEYLKPSAKATDGHYHLQVKQ